MYTVISPPTLGQAKPSITTIHFLQPVSSALHRVVLEKVLDLRRISVSVSQRSCKMFSTQQNIKLITVL